ncbi:hypothetical protein CFOL_v3_23247 [Cephalotus follicularis]|uniref:Uncharacterized protein n=1 Tax=Cephalotus follicularis TaxID=3775 RepID=A0A1Q3CHP5_CEPFO|nr:hypothetical protein CFOL_v3_23247 [Cephalotus follicularis]
MKQVFIPKATPKQPEKFPTALKIQELKPDSSQLMLDSKNPLTDFLRQQADVSEMLPVQQITLSDSTSTVSDSVSKDLCLEEVPIFMNESSTSAIPHEGTEEVDPSTVHNEPEGFPEVTSMASETKDSFFTLDDVSPSQWRERLHELTSWCFTELQQSNITINQVISRAIALFIRTLKEWWYSLGPYKPKFSSLLIYSSS